jgi:hypothetical protein
LRDESDNFVSSAAGATASADLGNTTASIELPPLTLQVDVQRGVLVGQGPANTPFYVLPAVPCPSQQQPNILSVSIQIGFPQTTGADGSFVAALAPFAGQGGGVEIPFYDANDHRWFRQVYVASADVIMRTARVQAQANALETVHLALTDGSGMPEGPRRCEGRPLWSLCGRARGRRRVLVFGTLRYGG